MAVLFLIFLLVCLSPASLCFRSEIPGAEFVPLFYLWGAVFLATLFFRPASFRSFRITGPDLWVAVFFVWVVVSGFLFNASPREWISLAKEIYPFLFYLLFRVLCSPKEIPLFFLSIVLAAVGQMVWSSFSTSALLGGFWAVACAAALGCAARFTVSGTVRRVAVGGVTVVCLSGLLFFMGQTNSRASVCAVAAVFLLTLWYGIKTKRPAWAGVLKRHRILLSVLLLGVCLAGIFGLYRLRPASAEGRVLIWQASKLLVKEKPFFGHGVDGFRQNYMFCQAGYLEENPETPLAMLASDNALAFNEGIRLGVEYGLAGLCIVACLVVCCLRAVPRNPKQKTDAFFLKTILITILVFGLFSYPLDAFQFRLVVCLCAAFLARLSPKVCTSSLPAGFSGRRLAVMGAVFLCLYLSAALPVYRFTKAAHTFSAVVKNGTNNLQKRQMELLEGLYPELCHTMEYLHYYGERLNKRQEAEKALRNYEQLEKYFPSSYQQIQKGMALETLGRIPEARTAWLLAGKMVPALIRPHYLLARSYDASGEREQAVRHARIVLTKEIKVYTPEVYYMKQEMKKIVN